jgi:hypothetical protein
LSRVVTVRLLALGALVLCLLAPAAPGLAFQAELARYYHAVRNICQTGITPDILTAYEQARRALERARYGGGRDSNFWGLKEPEGFWLDCLQSPGDGKT